MVLVLELVGLLGDRGGLWSSVVCVAVVADFLGSLGGKYIAFVFESTSPLPICIRRPKRLKRWKM